MSRNPYDVLGVSPNASDDEIKKIIEEESGAFFAGKKSVNDVANIIQSRVELYISENK